MSDLLAINKSAVGLFPGGDGAGKEAGMSFRKKQPAKPIAAQKVAPPPLPKDKRPMEKGGPLPSRWVRLTTLSGLNSSTSVVGVYSLMCQR